MFVEFVQHVANLPSLNANVRKSIQIKINEKGLIKQCEQFFQVKNINCSKIHSFTCRILLENVSNLIEVLVQVYFSPSFTPNVCMCVLLVYVYFNVSVFSLEQQLSFILIVEINEEFPLREIPSFFFNIAQKQIQFILM